MPDFIYSEPPNQEHILVCRSLDRLKYLLISSEGTMEKFSLQQVPTDLFWNLSLQAFPITRAAKKVGYDVKGMNLKKILPTARGQLFPIGRNLQRDSLNNRVTTEGYLILFWSITISLFFPAWMLEFASIVPQINLFYFIRRGQKTHKVNTPFKY